MKWLCNMCKKTRLCNFCHNFGYNYINKIKHKMIILNTNCKSCNSSIMCFKCKEEQIIFLRDWMKYF